MIAWKSVLPYHMVLEELAIGKKTTKQRKIRQLLALEKEFTRKSNHSKYLTYIYLIILNNSITESYHLSTFGWWVVVKGARRKLHNYTSKWLINRWCHFKKLFFYESNSIRANFLFWSLLSYINDFPQVFPKHV